MPLTGKGIREMLLVAMPVAQGLLCMHFGHCEQFALLDVDTAGKDIIDFRESDPPPHEPGVLPRWLHDQGVNLVIAGGIGRRARDMLTENGIVVIVGAPAEPPGNVIQGYLDGNLQAGENICDH